MFQRGVNKPNGLLVGLYKTEWTVLMWSSAHELDLRNAQRMKSTWSIYGSNHVMNATRFVFQVRVRVFSIQLFLVSS